VAAPSPVLRLARLGRAHGRALTLVVLLAAAGALIAAEFMTLREIKAITAVPAGGITKGGAHHGYALAVVGAAVVPMAFGAVVRGARPAAVALVVLGVVAAGIVLLADLPALNDAGLIGRTYELAEAHPGAGFWVEAAGAAALLLSSLVVLRRVSRS
jgi:hypothetical protein